MKTGYLLGLSLLTLGLVAALLGLGSVSIPSDQFTAALQGKGIYGRILWDLRLPKVLTAAGAGAGLAVAGLLMQTLFSNPLAGPYVLGINSGASLGVALLVLVMGSGILSGIAGGFAMVVAAFIGAGLVLLLVLALAERVRTPVTLLILGLMFGSMASALVSILIYFATPNDIQAFILWTFGSFRSVGYSELSLMLPLVAFGLGLALFLPKPLNALLLGEEYAQSLGVEVKAVRRLLLLAASILAGGITAFCGPIAFLGIAVPHLCRFLFATSDHRLLLPACMLLGADLALAAELVAGVPGSSQALPINAILALAGAPVVLWVILKGKS